MVTWSRLACLERRTAYLRFQFLRLARSGKPIGVLALVSLAACADPSSFFGPDSGTAQPCAMEGQTRCFGQTWERCQGGVYMTATECAPPRLCLDQQGCVECDPSLSRSCVGNDVYLCSEAGKLGSLVEKCGALPCKNGVCGSSCSQGTGLIYVVDDENRFLSFNPENNANTLKQIGILTCLAGPSWPAWASATATPFSMSVDRQGKAWVLYTSGEIFWVDIKTAACKASPYPNGQNGYQLFGMGFVSDSAGSQSEKLYIHGGEVNKLQQGKLAAVDPITLAVSTIGPLALSGTEHSPELTGTGNGVLFGFFPNGAASAVRRIDKASGAILQSWPVSAPPGTVRAWAFAHWGGKFYIFITVAGALSENSMILMLEPDTARTVTLRENLPYAIVGAGVSTCAPVLE